MEQKQPCRRCQYVDCVCIIKEHDWMQCPICMKWFVIGEPWERHKNLPFCKEDPPEEEHGEDLGISGGDGIGIEE